METTMKSFERHLILLFLFSIIIMIHGCASVPPAPAEKTKVTTGGNYNPPSWVNKGSGAFKDADGIKVIYGVGVADGDGLGGAPELPSLQEHVHGVKLVVRHQQCAVLWCEPSGRTQPAV